MSTGSSGQQSQGVGSPISNEAYNVLAALHAKLEGLEAMRKFSAQGNQPIWQQLRAIASGLKADFRSFLRRFVHYGMVS